MANMNLQASLLGPGPIPFRFLDQDDLAGHPVLTDHEQGATVAAAMGQ
jgi:hypothetical protein